MAIKPRVIGFNHVALEVGDIEEALGPVDIHLSHIMALTKNSIDTYDSAVFS